MAVFSDRMVPEKVQVFWAALQAGEFITTAAARPGTYRVKGRRWIVAAGGVRPRRGRHLVGPLLPGMLIRVELLSAGMCCADAVVIRLGRLPVVRYHVRSLFDAVEMRRAAQSRPRRFARL